MSINLFQSISREQSNKAGFKDTGLKWHQLSRTLGEFVQILILSDRNHLKVFAKDPGGDEVHVCDSLNSYGRGYSRETSKSICQKSFCSSATLQIINMPVQHQSNNVNCWVSATAFTTDCILNIKPEIQLTKRM